MKASNILRWYGSPEGLGYGYLYNGYIVKSYNGVSELINNLSIPTQSQWDTMISYIGGDTNGGKLKELEYTHWDSPNTGASNIFNFNAIAGGNRPRGDSTFQDLREYGRYWTSTEVNSNTIYYFSLWNENSSIVENQFDNPESCSIRCMRVLTAQEQIDYSDGEVVETKSDYNGNNYDVVRIGTQGWTNSNLKCINTINGTIIPVNPSSGLYLDIGAWAYNNDENYV